MNQSLVGYYLMPLWCPLIAVGMVALGLEKLGLRPSVLAARTLFGAIYAVLCGGLYWQLFRTPKSNSLVLHEQGFRFKDKVVAFDDLRSIRFGGKFSAATSALVATNRLLGTVSPRNAAAAELLERGREGSVTLVFQDGREQSLGGLLIRPRPDDLERFFDQLRSIVPGLVDDGTAPSPEVADLPFKLRNM